MTISENSAEQHCQKKQKIVGKKTAKLRKSNQRGSAKSKTVKSAHKKERRFAVLEQLRTMVGCEPGCGQFEIVQRVIHYIGQLNQQLQSVAVQQCSPNDEMDEGIMADENDEIVGQNHQISTAAFNQLVASLSTVWTQRGKKANKKSIPRAQRTR